MQKSINRPPYTHSTIQMKQSSHGKNLDYTTHKQSFPLQLNGNMRRHSQHYTKENIKSLINYEQAPQNKHQHQKYVDENCHKGQIRQNRNHTQENKSSSVLAEKILHNNKLSTSKYEKSVLPFDDPRSTKIKPQSVKTFKQERQGTGISYVLGADERHWYKKPQRRHVEQKHEQRRQTYGRKCDRGYEKQSGSRQMMQAMTQGHTQANIPFKQLQNTSSIFSTVHPTTTSKRITNDIHSSYQLKQSQTFNPKKPNPNNQFKTGTQLGYQYKKQKPIAAQKLNQLIGSYFDEKNTVNLRQKRDDWRKSSIVIQ